MALHSLILILGILLGDLELNRNIRVITFKSLVIVLKLIIKTGSAALIVKFSQKLLVLLNGSKLQLLFFLFGEFLV